MQSTPPQSWQKAPLLTSCPSLQLWSHLWFLTCFPHPTPIQQVAWQVLSVHPPPPPNILPVPPFIPTLQWESKLPSSPTWTKNTAPPSLPASTLCPTLDLHAFFPPQLERWFKNVKHVSSGCFKPSSHFPLLLVENLNSLWRRALQYGRLLQYGLISHPHTLSSAHTG